MRSSFYRKKLRRAGIALLSVIVLSGAVVFGVWYTLFPHKGWEHGSEVKCLALALYWEGAGSEPIEGLRGITLVIFNRVASHDFPKSVCGVVAENRTGKRDQCQFSFACDGRDETPHNTNRWLWYLTLASWWSLMGPGQDPTGGATHYYAHGQVTPYWLPDMEGCMPMGNHTFCRSKYMGRDVARK